LLPNDLVSCREGNQVRETLQREEIGVADMVTDCMLQAEKLSQKRKHNVSLEARPAAPISVANGTVRYHIVWLNRPQPRAAGLLHGIRQTLQVLQRRATRKVTDKTSDAA
jgi:hypothetical protein